MPRPPAPRRPPALALVVALAGVAIGGGCRNLAPVEDDRLYRSAQLEPDELREVVRDHGIKTVVNLRGPSPGKDWYDGEVAACKDLGVVHRDVRLSARRWPRADEVLALLDAFDQAEYPMLVHCIGGADRSGLAAAVYRIDLRGHPVADADDELTIFRGHLGPLSGTSELDDFLDLYADTGRGKPFRRWVRYDYERERDRLLDPASALRPRPPALPVAAPDAPPQASSEGSSEPDED